MLSILCVVHLYSFFVYDGGWIFTAFVLRCVCVVCLRVRLVFYFVLVIFIPDYTVIFLHARLCVFCYLFVVCYDVISHGDFAPHVLFR